ncbi:hypothetical protein [Thiorhodovibrio frisius]|nr:hypothetical protein [Thiorhodovibrio frisius]
MEAWVAFNLNEAPIQTERDGDFNVVALMVESRKLGIEVMEMTEDLLQPLIAEARDSFREHFAASRLH